MITSYSKEFLDGIEESNLAIANELLSIFNAAFFEIKHYNDRIVLAFRQWDKNGLTSSTFIKSFVLHSDREHLVKRIISECDRDAFTRATVNDELRVTVEKYALQDFIELVIKDFEKQELEIRDQVQVTFVLNPVDANLIVNDKACTTINGVCTMLFFEGEEINVLCNKETYKEFKASFTAEPKVFTIDLEQILYNVHLAPVPKDAEVRLYHGNIPKLPEYVGNNTSLTDEIPPNSLDDDLIRAKFGDEIKLFHEQDMLLARLPMGEYTVKASKRLFANYHESFVVNDHIFKTIALKPHFVHVELTVDPVYRDAYTSLNGKSIELPYSFNMSIGESALIESHYQDLEYRNYIIANEADVRQGLQYQISFIKMYTIDLRVPDEAKLYINNQLQATPYYSGEFTPCSRIDVRVEQEGFVPVTDVFYMTRDIQKIYKLEERLPYFTLKYNVTPEDAYVTVNGKPVANPFEADFIEGSEVTLRASKQNYIAYNETIIMNTNEERNIVLEQYEMFKPTVKITCNVSDVVCFINDQKFDLPANITVEQGSRLKVNIRAEGYKDHNEIIEVKNLDIERNIQLEEMTQDEINDIVNIIINVNRINSVVMLNNKQIDGEVITSETGEITNYLFKTTVPRGTYCQLMVTNPGYYPYSESFVPETDFERNVILSKEPQYVLHRVNIFSRTAGSILEVNGKLVSSPYVHDFVQGSEIAVRCHLDGYETYSYEGVVDRDIILAIELNKLDNDDEESHD